MATSIQNAATSKNHYSFSVSTLFKTQNFKACIESQGNLSVLNSCKLKKQITYFNIQWHRIYILHSKREEYGLNKRIRKQSKAKTKQNKPNTTAPCLMSGGLNDLLLAAYFSQSDSVPSAALLYKHSLSS